MEAAKTADAAFPRWAFTEQPDVFGKTDSECIVIVKRKFDICVRPPDSIAVGLAGIGHIVHHGAIPFLCNRPSQQLGKNPETLHLFLIIQAVQREWFHHTKSAALIQYGFCG